MAGSGFTNFQTIQALNAPGTARMTDDLYQRLAQRAEAARGALAAVPDVQDEEAMDPIRRLYDRAQQSMAATGTQPGVQALLQEGRGGGYTQGASTFDSALVSGGGAGRLAQLRGQYAGLGTEIKARQNPAAVAQTPIGPGIKDGGPSPTDGDLRRRAFREQVQRAREARGQQDRGGTRDHREPYGQDPLHYERYGR